MPQLRPETRYERKAERRKMQKVLLAILVGSSAWPCLAASSIRTVQNSPVYFANAIIALDENSVDFSRCLADLEKRKAGESDHCIRTRRILNENANGLQMGSISVSEKALLLTILRSIESARSE
jgi:hypothetical protein